MKEIKQAARMINRHGRILLRGFVRMTYGAATAGLFLLAAYGFYMIPKEGGYTAVCDFIGAIATMSVALICMYHQGGGVKKRKGGYEK